MIFKLNKACEKSIKLKLKKKKKRQFLTNCHYIFTKKFFSIFSFKKYYNKFYNKKVNFFYLTLYI